MYLYMPYFLSSAIKSRFERLKIRIKKSDLKQHKATAVADQLDSSYFLETLRNFLTIGYRSFRFFKHAKQPGFSMVHGLF